MVPNSGLKAFSFGHLYHRFLGAKAFSVFKKLISNMILQTISFLKDIWKHIVLCYHRLQECIVPLGSYVFLTILVPFYAFVDQ